MRIGAVNYLNSKPLVYGLEALAPEVRLTYDLPSRLADSLAAGRLDVALVPSVEFFRAPGYRDRFGCVRGLPRAGAEREAALSRAAERSAARGARRRIADERGADADSAGGVVRRAAAVGAVADWLRARGDGCGCGAVDWGSGDCGRSEERGARSRRAAVELLRRLGSWASGGVDWTGLPFVFAMWIARPDVDVSEVAACSGGGARSRACDSWTRLRSARRRCWEFRRELATRYLAR